MSVEFTVYSKPQCVQCDATYRALDKKGGDYIVEDAYSTKGMAIAQENGFMSAPIVVVTSKDTGETLAQWSGYSPDKINAYF